MLSIAALLLMLSIAALLLMLSIAAVPALPEESAGVSEDSAAQTDDDESLDDGGLERGQA